MMSGPSKKLEMVDPRIQKKHRKWEIGLHVSYRAQNLHAEIFVSCFTGVIIVPSPQNKQNQKL